MRNLVCIVLFLTYILPTSLMGQEVTDSLISNLYEQTVYSYFSTHVDGKGFWRQRKYYIQSNTNLQNQKSKFKKFELHFVEEWEEFSLIDKGETEEIYWLKIQGNKIDTIDFNIGGWIVGKEGNNYKYGARCLGDAGNVPEGRMYYDYSLKKWMFLSKEDILK